MVQVELESSGRSGPISGPKGHPFPSLQLQPGQWGQSALVACSRVSEQWMGFRMSPRALGMPVCRVIFWCNSRCSQNWDSIPQVAGSWEGVFIVPVPLSLRAPGLLCGVLPCQSDSSFPSTPPTSSS